MRKIMIMTNSLLQDASGKCCIFCFRTTINRINQIAIWILITKNKQNFNAEDPENNLYEILMGKYSSKLSDDIDRKN